VTTRSTGHKLNGDQPNIQTICWMDKSPLPPGHYRISVSIIADGESSDMIPGCLTFHIDSSTFFPYQVPVNTKFCPVFCDHRWERVPCR
jgi:hypothetical protein